eukprot:m.1676306 g.1676306  ORF g.1676306 m.1676306 type:complete len:53 (-) comp188877_c0_seq1:118-276(-)
MEGQKLLFDHSLSLTYHSAERAVVNCDLSLYFLIVSAFYSATSLTVVSVTVL